MAKNTVTTPNWNTDSYENNLSIGQENQFASTRGLRYGPLRINKTGIFVNNGTLDSTIINNTGFHGYGLSGIEQITLDASTGLNVTDGTNSVLQAVVSGTNVGDVTIGNYAGNNGAFYDKSTNTFYFKGTLSADIVVATGALTVGSNVGIGTAFPAASAGDLAYEDVVEKAKLGTTIIQGGYIKTDLLTASNITTGTLTGVTVQSGTGSERIVLSNGDYIYFYSGGNLKCQLRGTTAGTGGLSMTGDLVMQNNKSVLIADTTGGSDKYGGISITSSNQFWITLGTDQSLYIKNNAQNDNYCTVSYNSLYHRNEILCRMLRHDNGNLTLQAESGYKVRLNNNIDMGNNNIDECTTIWAYNFSNRSDEKLKKNIEESSNNLDLLSKLKPVTFNWKNLNKKLDDKKHLGLIAQDVEKVLPEVVISDDNGVKAINYNELIPLLIGGVNELQKIIKSL